MSYRILILGAGGSRGLSGVHENLFPALAKKHDLVGIIDTKLSGFWKYWNALYCLWRFPSASKYFHPIRTILGEEINYYRMRTKYYVLKRAEACEREIQKIRYKYDVILQTSWQPAIRTKPTVPRCIYIDFTMKLAEREYPPWTRFLSKSDKKVWEIMENKTFQNANLIFTFSDNTRNSVINDYNINREKVITVYSGVNLKKLPDIEKNYDKKIILFVGVEFERKGGLTLLRAFKEVKREIPDSKLVIVGSTPHTSDKGVVIKGYISRSELLQLYTNASIFVMPSICDPFPNVFLEAMAYKNPCIGSTASGIPEIIKEGKTGFLVSPNNYKQLADKLILLLEDENLMKEMGEAGRKRVEKYFTWDLVVDRMTKQFELMISKL